MATEAAQEPRPPLLTVVGGNVYRRRVLRIPRMSQEELARVSGVALNTIAVLEAARDPDRNVKANSPKLVTLELLADALGCEPADLLRWEPEATRAFRNGQRPLSAVRGRGHPTDGPRQSPLVVAAR